MGKQKQLTKKQLAVIDDLFFGELDEQAVLEKHNVNRTLYNRWLADENFVAEFDRRVASAYRQSAALVARYAPVAAAKLIQLTCSEKEETARRACLDIISLALPKAKPEPAAEPSEPDETCPAELSPETASRLLEALAKQA